MSYVLIHCKVEDYARWKPLFDEDSANRKAGGSKGGHLYRNANDPHEAIMVFEWDAGQAGQYMQSPALAATMQQAGVVGMPDVYFLDAVEDVDQ